ncbi:hypothetical protein SADUNF_Sadunf01G0032700 [Salix dunnii]|uniref:Protein kinase domain-containing protein n=1 Tax=Salix dunnii TaxID=1413687 RepID=A0A835N9N1_9ROSI|nr:hypothetical protein SADUNF_Sadunf01G0032700 [Salix dunnii]
MPSRPLSPSFDHPRPSSLTRILLLTLTVSASVVMIFTIVYFLYHLWCILLNRSRTIPFDSSAPLRLQRFSYKELKIATDDFDDANIIGKGGTATVYRGMARDGKLYAIKRLGDTLSLQSEREFQNEMQILGAKISDFGLSRIKGEGGFGVDLFSQDLGKSQELSGNVMTSEIPPIGTPVESCHEVDFAIALQASSSSKNSRTCYNVKALNLSSLSDNANIVSESVVQVRKGKGKGKEVSSVDIGGDDWNCKFVPYDDDFCSNDHSKELDCNSSSVVDDLASTKKWGKDWWWRQDGSGELCSKDYVVEWIGSQICPSANPDWDGEKRSTPGRKEMRRLVPLNKVDGANEPPRLKEFKFENHVSGFEKKKPEGRKNRREKNRKTQEWWKDEYLDEINHKGSHLKNLETKWKRGFRIPHFDLGRRFRFHRRKNLGEQNQNDADQNGEFSFRRGWKKKNARSTGTSDMWSGDLFSRELSSTTSMRGTLCYVAPEYGGCGYLTEKADIYSLGVLILVIVSGRRPLHVLASPMKLEKANLISWCRQLARTGNILELVDERVKDEYSKEQARLCINLALSCLQRLPELRPDIGEIVKILKGEMDPPPLPFELSSSPPSKLFSRSRRKQNSNAE